MDRSDSEDGRDEFVGFRCNSDRKELAEKRAQEEGVTLSEWFRRQLSDLDKAADQTAATT